MTCEHWWGIKHNFGEWKKIEEGAISRTDVDEQIGTYLVQERQCINCKWIERKHKNVAV